MDDISNKIIIPDSAYADSPTNPTITATTSSTTPVTTNDISNKIVVPESAYADNRTPGVGDRLADNIQTIHNGTDATMNGIQRGIMDYAATVAKGTSKALNLDTTPQQLQDQYDKDEVKYNYQSSEHPILSTLGRLTGNVISSIPATVAGSALGLGAVGSLGAKAVEELGGGAFVSGAARLAGDVVGNAINGGIQGSLMTQAGQGADVINQKGMQYGSLFGGTVGTLGQKAIGAYANNLQNYTSYSKDLVDAGYPKSAPVFSTDVPGNQGIYNSIKEGAVNGAINRIPVINMVPGIGTQSARNAQISGLQTALKSMANQYTTAMPEATQQQFKNAILAAKATSDQSISDTSNAFRQLLNQNGITSHNMDTSLPLAQDILNKYSHILPDNTLETLKSFNNTATTNDLLGTASQAGLRQRTWAAYQDLADIDRSADPTAFNAANKLHDLYHAISADINNSVQGNNKAVEAFNHFNTTTTAQYAIWNKANNPELVKAFQNINNNASGMMTFYNKLVSGKMAISDQAKYATILGDQGMDAVQQGALQKAFQSSKVIDPISGTDTGDLNIGKFLSTINNTNPNLIPSDIKSHLNAIQWMANKVAQGTNMASDGTNLALGGAVGGALAVSNVARVLAASGAALGAITAHPPIKNTLMAIDKLTQSITGDTPMSTYLLNAAQKNFSRVGISLIHNADGSIKLDRVQQ